MSSAETKEFWPELEGLDLNEAREIIANERPDLRIVVEREGSTRERELRLNRVILYVDGHNKLTRPPRIG